MYQYEGRFRMEYKNELKITVQKAVPGDAEALTAIQKQAFERLYHNYRDEASPYLRGSDEMKLQMENGARDIYKIYTDGALCGGVAVRNKGGGEYYLNRVFVSPRLQGKGAGRAAIGLVEKFYPDAKRWTVDFPADQAANKKCYEYCGYYDTGTREVYSDALTLALYEKSVNGIFEIRQSQLELAAGVIRGSFATVAAEFGLTEQNCPTHTSFITAEKLKNHFDRGWRMYGLYESGRLAGYVSLSGENDDVYELHNLAVAPERRRLGYGGRLLAFCKEKIKESGGSKITIGIIEANAALKNWYLSRGFAHTGVKTFAHLPFTVGFMEWENQGQ